MNKTKILATVLALITGVVAPFYQKANAEQPKVSFIDVSHHNSNYGLPLSFYQTIKAGGVKGVVVKVSEGSYYLDPAASVNIANAKQAKLIVNAYHFARFTSVASAEKEADWFDKKLKVVGFDKNKDGYVTVDVEDANLSKDPSTLTKYVNAFYDEMKKLGYNRIDIYSGSYYYNSRLKPKELKISKPWLASYPSNPQAGKPTANFTNGKGAWQWASDYKFIGMSSFGYFDVSEDYAGKYTEKTKSTQVTDNDVGKIESVSLVDYMKSKKMDSSFTERKKLATKYGITNYSGTQAQNLALLSKLKSGEKPAKVNTTNSKITTSSKSEATSVKQTTYKIKRGDTLSLIATKYKTTVSKLCELNNIKNANKIYIGETIKITTVDKKETKSRYYIVKKGDTLSIISKAKNVSISKLKSLNKLKDIDVILVGQKLVLY